MAYINLDQVYGAPVSEEKRIYVVVAEQIVIPDPDGGVVVQPAGRIAAQCAHVVSKARFFEAKRGAEWFCPVTTIILSARNNKELMLLGKILSSHWIDPTYFQDNNAEAYYTEGDVLTAICTGPINPKAVEGILDHLPLWSPKCA